MRSWIPGVTGAAGLWLPMANEAQAPIAQQVLRLTQGQSLNVDLSHGRWQPHTRGWVWRYQMPSAEASLIAFMAEHDLPEAVVLDLSTERGVQWGERLTAVGTSSYNRPPLAGAVPTLELRTRVALEADAFRIVAQYDGVQQAKTANTTPPPGNALCESSPDTARAARNTVSLMISPGSGQVFCSGKLVNDMTGTGAHRILTAAHCGNSVNHVAARVHNYKNATSNCADGLTLLVTSDSLSSTGYRTLVIANRARIDGPSGVFRSISGGDHWLISSDAPPPQGSALVWAELVALVREPPQDSDPTFYPVSVIPSVFSLSHPMGLTQSIARLVNRDGGGQFARVRNRVSNLAFDQEACDGTASYAFYFDATAYSVRNGSSGRSLRLPGGRVIGVQASCSEFDEINPNTGQPMQAYQYDKLSAVWTGGRMGSPRLDSWLDPQSTGRRVSDEFLDASRTENLVVRFASNVSDVPAGGSLQLTWLLDEATRCERASAPSIASSSEAQVVFNGTVQREQVVLPKHREYRLSVRRKNAAGFSVERAIVANRRTTLVDPPSGAAARAGRRTAPPVAAAVVRSAQWACC